MRAWWGKNQTILLISGAVILVVLVVGLLLRNTAAAEEPQTPVYEQKVSTVPDKPWLLKPEPPSVTREHTKQGMSRSFSHFLDTYNYVQRGGEFEALTPLMDPACEFCKKRIKNMKADKKRGTPDVELIDSDLYHWKVDGNKGTLWVYIYNSHDKKTDDPQQHINLVRDEADPAFAEIKYNYKDGVWLLLSMNHSDMESARSAE